MTPETLAVFGELMGQVNVPASDANFDRLCELVSRAKRELAAALSEAGDPVLADFLPTGNGSTP
jgi:hypothetical protein